MTVNRVDELLPWNLRASSAPITPSPLEQRHDGTRRALTIALGRSNWLFAGSLRVDQRAAAVMSLIQSAKLNGHDPYAYLRDVLARPPTQPNRRLDELLPHRWQPRPA
jgi:hypothetical protein